LFELVAVMRMYKANIFTKICWLQEGFSSHGVQDCYYWPIDPLEKRRNMMHREVMEMLLDGTTNTNSDCRCSWWNKHAVAYMELL
jgi:hypothetical protein